MERDIWEKHISHGNIDIWSRELITFSEMFLCGHSSMYKKSGKNEPSIFCWNRWPLWICFDLRKMHFYFNISSKQHNRQYDDKTEANRFGVWNCNRCGGEV